MDAVNTMLGREGEGGREREGGKERERERGRGREGEGGREREREGGREEIGVALAKRYSYTHIQNRP